MSALIPSNFKYDSPRLYKGGLIIPGHLVIIPPKELSAKASKVIRTYLKKTLPVLRLMGGSTEYPLLKAGLIPARFSHLDDNNCVLQIRNYYAIHGRAFDAYTRCQKALDVIEADDLTLDGLLDVYATNYWGKQDKKNLFNRMVSALREHLIIRYMERDQNDGTP